MRDEKVDILRFIGLVMIILAHVGPPPLIFQLRNFDVPLMVLISGVSFVLSYKGEPYLSYVWKRIKRLLFPIWIFLTGYFLVIYMTGYPIHWPGFGKIVSSYLLLSGIGYVWVIRVFLLVAIVAPFIMKFHKKTSSHTRYFSILSAVIIGYELISLFTKPYLRSAGGTILENIALYIVPYSIIFAIGLRLPELTRKQVLRLVMGSFAIFGVVGLVIFTMSGKIVPVQAFKYPPSIYYLSYGLGTSGAVWLVSDKILATIKRIGLILPILFIAQNSMWIYLWHIPMVEIIQVPFYLKYPLVVALASLVVFAQVRLMKQGLLPHIKNNSIRKNLNLLFTG